MANRVRELKRYNKDVRNALAAFERNRKKTKRLPRVDDATSFVADIPQQSASAKFLNTSFTPPQVLENGIEIISIPTYSSPGEWHGTLIATKYDASGNFLSQWICDVIMVPDVTYTYWDVIYEVSFEDGNAYLEYGNPNLYDDMGGPIGDGEGPAPEEGPVASESSRSLIFQKASFTPQRMPGLPGARYPVTPKMRQTMKCVGITCGSLAAGCGVASAFFLGAPFAPCFVGGCVAGVVGCIGFSVFGG